MGSSSGLVFLEHNKRSKDIALWAWDVTSYKHTSLVMMMMMMMMLQGLNM